MSETTPQQYRSGTCSACGATYKLPASFEAAKAKCKTCGAPSVEVGPVETAAPPPVPAARPEPIPVKKKKREGPSMKEQLLARRAAEQAAPPAAAARRAAPAAPRPTPARAAAPAKPAVAKATAKPLAAKPARAAVAGGAARRGRASRSSGRRGSARRGAGEGEEGKAKKSKAGPLIGVLVLLAIIAFGVWKFVLAEPDEAVQAADTSAAAEVPPVGDVDTAAPEEVLPAEDSALEEAAPEEAGAAEGDQAWPGDEPKKDEPDPSSVDLASIPDFGPVPGTSEEEWAELQELMATYVDPDAGAAGARAGLALEEYEKKAMPVVVNYLKGMDFSTEQGYRNGDIAQRLLMKICNGTNVGWKYSTEPADVVFNKKAAKMWCTLWERAADDDAYWLNMSKRTGEAEETPEEESAVSAEDLDALDDL